MLDDADRPLAVAGLPEDTGLGYAHAVAITRPPEVELLGHRIGFDEVRDRGARIAGAAVAEDLRGPGTDRADLGVEIFARARGIAGVAVP